MCVRRRDSPFYALKELSVFLKMCPTLCGSCRAPLSDWDHHDSCVSCLGKDHAVLALGDGGCHHCEMLPMATEDSPGIIRRDCTSARSSAAPQKSAVLSGTRNSLSLSLCLTLSDRRPPLPSGMTRKKPRLWRMTAAPSWLQTAMAGRALRISPPLFAKVAGEKLTSKQS